MKKQFVFWAVTAGLFTSCVQNDLIVPELSEVEKGIQFQAVVAKQNSRAIISGTSYDEGAPSFGAYAFWNETSLLPGSKHYIVNEEIKHFTGVNGLHYWSTDGTDYLWKKDGSLTFYAYSPYRFQEANFAQDELEPLEPELGNYGFRFLNYNVDIHQETDLMVADVVWGQTANSENIAGHTGVPTVFKHKLAQIAGFILKTSEDYDGLWDGTDEVNSGAAEGDIRFKIKKIQLKNIPVKGTFTSAGVEIDEDIIPEKWEITSTTSVTESVGEPGSTPEPEFQDYTWYDAGETGGLLFGNEDSKQLHLYTPLNQVSGLNYQVPSLQNGYILAIPQEFLEGSNASLDIQYTVEKYDDSTDTWINTRDGETEEFISKSMPLRAIHASKDYKGWGIGKKIYYTLDFSTEEIRWAPSVVDWTDENIKVDY